MAAEKVHNLQIVRTEAGIIKAPSDVHADVYAAALARLTEDRRSADTMRAYAGDLAKFFQWWKQVSTTPAALRGLCDLDAGQLAFTLSAYAAFMRSEKLSEATINRRLSSMRSLLRTARKLGAGNPDPAGLVDNEKNEGYRDTRGPSKDEVRRLLATPDRSTDAGKRDFAIIVVLWENATRRAELCSCNVGDFDPAQRRLYILGKGKGTQRKPVTLSERAVVAISEYLDTRGQVDPDAPLFTNRARFNAAGSRLTPDGLYYLTQKYGVQVLGRGLNPHAMRHAAITAALDATDGNVRMVQQLSRHADLRTLQKYDDSREDLQGKATTILSALA